MTLECEECGSFQVEQTTLEGVLVLECGLCGNLQGDDESISHVELVREAREKGVDPSVYPLVRVLDRMPGFRVVRSESGDDRRMVWPFVQLAISTGALASLENLVKSLALSGEGQLLHWVVEVEYQSFLAATLKPRFHRSVSNIGQNEVRVAQADLQQLHKNLTRDMRLSWWHS